VRWFPTENERIALFIEELGVSRDHLPTWRYESRNGSGTTLRWFVDKPPIFMKPNDPTVHFCFADPGYHTADSFASFLRNYRSLFARLQRFEVIYISLGPGGVGRARHTFERLISPSLARPDDSLVGALAEYFQDRHEHETAGLVAFDQKRLNRYRNSRKEFAGARFDRLFENWKRTGEGAIRNEVSPESTPDLRTRGAFTVHICTQRFDLLGSVLSGDSGAKRQNPLAHGGFGGGF
ncbi:MAG TPA: hypothetical protein VNH18_36515, partial [Bryobacteraceae bacterium]|nr:hypothetical protein [Bryobacteraceae bacterium]